MMASAAILNLTLTCYLNKMAILQYDGLARQFKPNLNIYYLNKTTILQYGDQRTNFNLLLTTLLQYVTTIYDT